MEEKLNEADTRALLIDPRLKQAGWEDSQIKREYYYQRNVKYTEGRIVLTGNRIKRGKPKRVDYLLRYTQSLPIAVVEAKPKDEPAESGLEQAKGYARDLGLAFAYATNGIEIIEFDFFTNTSRHIPQFPSPEELYRRWVQNTGWSDNLKTKLIAQPSRPYSVVQKNNPLLYPYCPESKCGKKPFYFQEVAVREILIRIMHGQKRILLTMATGTGKTFVAFQVVWKLIKSKWLQNLHPDRPARVLFIADRIVLRDQAYNTFSPFADGINEPRYKIEGSPVNKNRDLYFGIYQTLWSVERTNQRLFKSFPPDFFDLVIIDECHRSGFGTWREILDYFHSAIHLGMTATPKKDENIDTYAYFCSEEKEVYVDPDDPSKGKWKPPAYQYSLGRGIDDGFLATYKVYRVYTTVDKNGLSLRDAIEQGAEVFIPEDIEPRDFYTTPQFEREITLPDRTKKMVHHLASLLRKFGHMEKTMVFCVDMHHARIVAQLLQNEFGPDTGLSNYAVPIISEEGKEARSWLAAFADSDTRAPVVATTAELLSTGVDVPSCRNIVFMKTLSSPVLFKQIIGRGSRIDRVTDKYWFRIIDYTGATRLFDEWDRPMTKHIEAPKGPMTAILEGVVFDVESGNKIVGARVSVRIAPNSQRGPIVTDYNGEFRFEKLPFGKIRIDVSASGFQNRTLTVETIPDDVLKIEIPLKPKRAHTGKIRVEGLNVEIADEYIFILEETGEQLTLEAYKNYMKEQIRQRVMTPRDLKEIWIQNQKREQFIRELQEHGIHPEILAEAIGYRDADIYDILCFVAFGCPIRTRDERVIAFRNREQELLEQYQEVAREVILQLLEKYRVGGVSELTSKVFSVSPFKEMGGVTKISEHFGGIDGLRKILEEIMNRLYREESA